MGISSRQPILELRSISREFPGVRALDKVSLSIAAGECVALMGENGAGKSTLIKILSGVQRQSSGEILLDGVPVDITSPRRARQLGIATIHQELNLAQTLSVAENICMEDMPTNRVGLLDRKMMRSRAAAQLALLGVEGADVRALVSELPRSMQQIVEIAKGVDERAKILILDEPTASLGAKESDRLLTMVNDLKSRGIGIIYITHRLAEIEAIADTVVVLRDGRLVVNTTATAMDATSLVHAMTGRSRGDLYPRRVDSRRDQVVLEFQGVSSRSLKGIDLRVEAGEIVGLAGLLGSGKSDIGKTAFGLEGLTAGTITLAGAVMTNPSPARALRRGLVYYPSDRRREGVALRRPMVENFTMGALGAAGLVKFGRIKKRAELHRADEYAAATQLRPSNPRQQVWKFSGGNQQKVMLGRGMLRQACVHVFDEPTVGIDVGARAEIYKSMRALAAEGAGIMVISSDIHEILGIADRAYVVRDGRIAAHRTCTDSDFGKIQEFLL